MPPRAAPTPTSKARAPPPKARHKPTPKKVVPPAEKLKRLFKSLCAQIDGGHFKNAVKTCDKILRIDPEDEDARQAKLFLILQTEQYNTALTMLEGLDGSDDHAYERAYALYRLQRENEAAEVLPHLKTSKGSAGVNTRGVSHLEAQIKYRQSEYQEAFDLYTQLLDSSSLASEEHADLLTNLNAAQTHLDFLTTGYLHALDALPASVINTLEKSPPPVPPGSTLATNTTSHVSASSSPKEATPSEKKVRLSRVPKGVTPGVTPPPDPERWIKKSERTNIGHSTGKRRKAAGGGATQGSLAESVISHSAKPSSAKHKKKK